MHPKIFEEFPFLLAEIVPPRVLKPEVFAEFEQLYGQIEKDYLSTCPYRTRMIGNLFVVLLLKIKEYFWGDFKTYFKFQLNKAGKISRLEIGQASY